MLQLLFFLGGRKAASHTPGISAIFGNKLDWKPKAAEESLNFNILLLKTEET